MKNYITRDSAEKATPIIESNQASPTHSHEYLRLNFSLHCQLLCLIFKYFFAANQSF